MNESQQRNGNSLPATSEALNDGRHDVSSGSVCCVPEVSRERELGLRPMAGVGSKTFRNGKIA